VHRYHCDDSLYDQIAVSPERQRTTSDSRELFEGQRASRLIVRGSSPQLILRGTAHLSKKPLKKCHPRHSPLAHAADFGSAGQRPMERMCHSLIPSPVILNHVISHVSLDFRSGGFLRDTCDLRWYGETGFSVVRQRMEIETSRQKAAISGPEYALSDHYSRLLLSCDVSQSDSTAGNTYKQFTFVAIRSTHLTRSGSVRGLLCSPTLQIQKAAIEFLIVVSRIAEC
jgi:hypothetical protein